MIIMLSFLSNSFFQGSGIDYWVDINNDGTLNIKTRTLDHFTSPQIDRTENYQIHLSSNRLQKLHQLIRYIDSKAAKDLDDAYKLCDVGSYKLEIKDQQGNVEKAIYLSENFPSIIEELLDTERKNQFLANTELPKNFDIQKSIETCKAFNIFLGFISSLLPDSNAKVIKSYYP